MKLDLIRDIETGKLPSYAWPGGYQIVYYTRDGSTVCPDCANNEVDQSQEVIDGEVYWEGPAMQCDDCGKMLESAYGDPSETD